MYLFLQFWSDVGQSLTNLHLQDYLKCCCGCLANLLLSGCILQLDIGEQSIEAAALRASLLTFQDLILALDGEWVLSGLGHRYGLDRQAIRKAAVLHYNGNMKPWLEMGIPKYKGYWRKFLNRQDQILSVCNVNP